ncbi:MAG: hypothetical protein ABSD85_10200 [Acidimicrobiales bacterium]|jgi:hypothetical protein
MKLKAVNGALLDRRDADDADGVVETVDLLPDRRHGQTETEELLICCGGAEPEMSLPPDSRSSDAAIFATSGGERNGTLKTWLATATRLVAAAVKVSMVRVSKLGCLPEGWPTRACGPVRQIAVGDVWSALRFRVG